MEFEILDTIDPYQIQKSTSSLTPDNICEISLNVRVILSTLTPKQFIFLIVSLSKYSNNFINNMYLIDSYLKILIDDNIKLNIENILYNMFLKKYENEECYNSFFTTFSQYYNNKNKNLAEDKQINALWFFSQNPVFLAHTNAMFSLLEKRRGSDVEVYVAALSDNVAYRERCNDVGANFIVLEGANLMLKYKSLIEKSENALALCWNGSPTNLDYVSKLSTNTVWWTHRFHPKFEHIKGRISAITENKKQTIQHFGKSWSYFDSGFIIKNRGKTSSWDNRKYNFGSFCRESLIDNESHWKNVSRILEMDDKLTFYYAGRNQIHDQWCQKFKINSKKVNFLGWLKEPEVKIMDMAFLLDSKVLGHGLMGMEAVAGKIPIIQPHNTKGFYYNLLQQSDFKTLEKNKLKKIGWSIFQNQDELSSIVKTILSKRANLEIGQILHEKLLEREGRAGTFEQFCNLLDSRRFPRGSAAVS